MEDSISLTKSTMLLCTLVSYRRAPDSGRPSALLYLSYLALQQRLKEDTRHFGWKHYVHAPASPDRNVQLC